MIQLPCPWCGPRNASEFHYQGEATARPDVSTATPQEWRQYLFMRSNPCGWVDENWYHTAGCRKFIRIRRHTLSNETQKVAQ